MRLINVKTGQLCDFLDNAIPEYAILSHQWRKGEVLFNECENILTRNTLRFKKIKRCCMQARKNGLKYVWIDTCCINKSNSQELSEAINSMYKWYARARVCYAYLDDISNTSQIGKSRWFTRGWTLQELLAPKHLQFFAKDWTELGSKRELSHELERWTGIPAEALQHFERFRYSVAQKMSWASKRQTTRVEDRAYSLLGIFGVNLVLNYGEGEGAFRVLQQKIIERDNDDSILAWQGASDSRYPFLAGSPSEFENSGSIVLFEKQKSSIKSQHRSTHTSGAQNVESSDSDDDNDDSDSIGTTYDGFSLSNAGLSINLFLHPYFPELYVAILRRCRYSGAASGSSMNNFYIGRCPNVENPVMSSKRDQYSGKYVGIYVKHSLRDGSYRRVMIDECNWAPQKYDLFAHGKLMSILINRQCVKEASLPRSVYGVRITALDEKSYDLICKWLISNYDHDIRNDARMLERPHVSSFSRNQSSRADTAMEMPIGDIGIAGIFSLGPSGGPTLLIHLGFDVDFSCLCLISLNDFGYFKDEMTQGRATTKSLLSKRLNPLGEQRSLISTYPRVGDSSGITVFIQRLLEKHNGELEAVRAIRIPRTMSQCTRRISRQLIVSVSRLEYGYTFGLYPASEPANGGCDSVEEWEWVSDLDCVSMWQKEDLSRHVQLTAQAQIGDRLILRSVGGTPYPSRSSDLSCLDLNFSSRRASESCDVSMTERKQRSVIGINSHG